MITRNLSYCQQNVNSCWGVVLGCCWVFCERFPYWVVVAKSKLRLGKMVKPIDSRKLKDGTNRHRSLGLALLGRAQKEEDRHMN
jgi:hypothetical protein